MKNCLAMMLALIMMLCLIPTTSVFAAKEESLTNLTLTVTSPQEGAKPAYDKIDGRGYYSDNGLSKITGIPSKSSKIMSEFTTLNI